MNLRSFEKTFNTSSKIWGVYLVLKDQQWRCRSCEYAHVGTTQIAGGAGIQGLQRGNRKRPGLVILSGNHLCVSCDRKTRQDRWTGAFEQSVASPAMPASFVRRALRVLGSRDVIEGTERPANQLTLDHKVPMLRWNRKTQKMFARYKDTSDEDIRKHFQLLKKSNGSVSHNLLKSRACEKCHQQEKRGAPFGIAFFHAGDGRWAPNDKKDPEGCEGCGWHDFDLWRQRLNQTLRKNRPR